MMQYVVCYKTKEPVIYNKGTQWETTCDTFLSFYMGEVQSFRRSNKNVQGIKRKQTIKALERKRY